MTIRNDRFAAAAIRAGGLLLAIALLAPLPAGAQLVSGLAGGSGSTVGPDGAIYVTEGLAGRVTRVDPVTGATSPFASGLPPAAIGVGGAMDVAFIGNTAYVLVAFVGDPLLPILAQNPALELKTDGIYRVDGPSEFTIIADLGEWSSSHLPPYFDGVSTFLVNGVQYAIEPFRGGFLVTDGHHNRVLEVGLDGEISEFSVFENVVPTGLEVHGNTVYMAETGPAPHNPEDGKLVAIKANTGAVTDVAAGQSMLVDVEFGRGQSLYVLAQGVWDGAFPGSPAMPFTGSLSKVNSDGTLQVIMTSLNLPTSMEFIGNTAYIVSLIGEIWVVPNVSPPPYGKKK